MYPDLLEVTADSIPPRLAGLWSEARAWLSKGSLALLDQALISGSNFFIGVLLARALIPEQYGGYALAFAIFLLLSLFYQALVLEPMGVFGASVYHDSQPRYFGKLLWIHGVIAAATFVGLGVSALAVQELAKSKYLSGSLLGVTIAAPCVLLFWLARRAFYVRLEPRAAVGGAVFYCLLLFIGLFVLYRGRLLSPFSAFLLMALGSLAASVLMLIRLKPRWRFGAEPPSLKDVQLRHWRYGRWALASSVMTWVPWNFYYAVLGHFSGMATAGEFRALQNLHLPLAQASLSLSLLFLPYTAQTGQREGRSGVGVLTWRITFLYGAAAIGYWIFLVLFRVPVIHLLYGGRYLEVTHLVPWLALASVLWTGVQGPATALRGMESPASVFLAYGASSAVTLVVGVPAAWAIGIQGAVLAMVLASAVAFASSVILVHRMLRA